jgi:predicted nucleotidyltransferase
MPGSLQQRLARAFEGAGEGVTSAYLFGSYAENRAHRDSDVDVGALLDWAACPGVAARFEARLRLIGELSRFLGRNDVDLVVLNDAPPHLARAVVTGGIQVFCRNTEADHEFRRTALLRAADLEPFLRRARQVKLAAIRR